MHCLEVEEINYLYVFVYWGCLGQMRFETQQKMERKKISEKTAKYIFLRIQSTFFLSGYFSVPHYVAPDSSNVNP